MHFGKTSSCRFAFGIRVFALLLSGFGAATVCVELAQASDVTWTNGAANSLWDTSSANWNTGAWNNANGDGAIFGPTGMGPINVTGPISVNSFNFTANGYSLNGVGPLNIVNGSSTQTTGVAAVSSGVTASINVPINSSLGFQKIGAGTLELSAPGSFSGGIGLDGRNRLEADLLVGGWFSAIPSGTLRVTSGSVIPASTRVSLSDGYLDIGSNNVTLSQLIFPNQNDPIAWNPLINAAGCGVLGSGTLRVIGDINVIGVTGGNFSSNTIAANLDMGGGTQIVRVGSQGSLGQSSALQFTGTISNGSLFKSMGSQSNGVQSTSDGMGLFGNNTYTGSTRLNGGTNVITGTNATTSVELVGGAVTLQGANGSLQSAPVLQANSGGTFVLDNNAAIPASGSAQPPTPAAQNNDRIRDDAEVQLRDGNFTYRGLATAAASETFGSLNVQGGQNVVTITPNGTGGTATLTASGNLTLAPRATMLVSSTTLGAASKMFVNGSLPAADATGILPRMVGTNDFLTYSGATGLTPYTGYAANFTTPGANVAYSATTSVASSVSINALKNSAAGNTSLTIGAGQTLGITSGMILNSGFGTATITGGTVDFGANPGVLFGTGNIVLSGPVTGSNGLISARGTNTVSGDLSGLTGAMDVNSGTMNLNSNSFAGPINVRNAQLSINTSQTLAGAGPITLGVAQNDADMFGLAPTLSLSGAPASSTFNRNIIVDNASTNAAGVPLRYSLVSGISALSNATGSQTISGNVVLNSPVRLQGGGASNTSTGSTNFTGNISGPAIFHVANGRANFSGNVSNAGGFNLGDQGFSMKVTFSGTGSGNGPVTISGGNTNTVSYMNGALPGGPISVWNSSAGTAPTIFPLNNSTINNQIVLGIGPKPGEQGDTVVNVGSGITAEWAGPITGFSPLTKSGVGGLVLSSMASTYTGTIADNAGTLAVNGALPAAAVTVANSAILGGTGVIGGNVTVNAGGLIGPGNSIGTLGVGNLSLSGSDKSEIDLNNGGPASADLLNVMGSISLSTATLNLPLSNAPTDHYDNGTYLLVANDGSDPISGLFASITGLPAGYSATIDYAFSGVDSIGRTGDGNDVAVTLVPEPTSLLLFGVLGAGLLAVRRRR